MTKIKKIIIRTILVFIIIIPMAAFAHYIAFPQETRSILIEFSGFKKQGSIYFNKNTGQTGIDSLQDLIQQASARITAFWGTKACHPKFIYCEQEADFKKYCVTPTAPAVTYLKLGEYIVLSSGGADIDIIAHEISHAEFYERVGFYKWTFAIPAWFKHGLAMQNDCRNYYSDDTLKALSNNFTTMPDIKEFSTNAQFYSGTRQQVMLHYMVAKHAIKNWYTKEKLDKLIKDLNAGKSFQQAFTQ